MNPNSMIPVLVASVFPRDFSFGPIGADGNFKGVETHAVKRRHIPSSTPAAFMGFSYVGRITCS
jgi:hypothetical protein